MTDFDVIVVGAGGGGPVVAKELAQRGLKVLMLEAGRFARDAERENTHLEIDQNHPLAGVLRWGPSDRSRPPWSRELPFPGTITQSAGVGGTTQQYFANSPRPPTGVFKDSLLEGQPDLYDRAHQYPFTYGDFVPYCRWVEDTLPVQTAAMGTTEKLFLEAAQRTPGLVYQTRRTMTVDAYRPQENAILQPQGLAGRTCDPLRVRYPQSQGCVFCGHCMQGCHLPLRAPRNLKAKRSTDNSYVPMALTAAGWAEHGRNAVVVPHAFVTRILHETRNGTPRATGVEWRSPDGTRTQATAQCVVLAAGAIETPRLYLNSGLPSSNGWVGAGVTDHYFDMVIGKLHRNAGLTAGPGSGARADFPGRGAIEPVGASPGSILQFFSSSLSGTCGMPGNDAANPLGADFVGRLAGNRYKRFFAELDSVLALIVITDDDVEPQNRITRSAAHDEHGPIARVSIDGRARSARTVNNRDFLVAKAVEILRNASPGEAIEVVRIHLAPALVHIQSSMRMGEDPANSVLDASCEVREVQRLFVADNSAQANGSGGVNPTLTTQALATRTAEKIFEKYFGGDPWVKSEQPISSTDPRVTAAVLQSGIYA
jgi:choline dehydrogenase-like flavoprotein